MSQLVKPGQKPEKDTKQKQHRRFRWLYRSLIGIVLLLLSVQVAFFYFAEPILKNWITQKVFDESKGVYHIEFDNIRVNVSTRSIHVKGFKLKPDVALYRKYKQEGKTDKALYAINFSEFVIRNINVYRLYLNSDLYIRRILIKRPLVRIIELPEDAEKKNEKYDAVHEDLYPAISEYLNSLSIKNIDLINGYFDFFIRKDESKMVSTAHNITIGLTRFHLDEQAYIKRQNLFYSDNIKLLIKNYVLGLKDSIHVLKANEVAISTDSAHIHAIGVSLMPEQVQEKNLPLLSQSYYKLQVPRIEINGANLHQIYFDKIVDVKDVELIDPSIALTKPQKKRRIAADTVRKNIIKKIATDKMNLYQLISGRLKKVKIDSFAVLNASLQMYKGIRDNQPAYTVESCTLEFDKFKIDSMAHLNTKKLFYADDIRLFMKNYNMRLGDNVHRLHADTILIASEYAKIVARRVHLSPLHKSPALTRYSGRGLYDFYIPSLEIAGVDLHKAYHYKHLPIKSLVLETPDVGIIHYHELHQRRKKNKARKRNPGKLNAMLSGFLHSITIDRLELNDGNFDMGEFEQDDKVAFTSGKISLQLNQLRIDSRFHKEISEYLRAGDVFVKFNDFSMKLVDNIHVMKMNEIGISTIDSTVYIKGLTYRPLQRHSFLSQARKNNLSIIYDISISDLKLQKADIKNAYFDKILKITNFNIDEPKITIIRFDKTKKKHAQKSKQTDSKHQLLSTDTTENLMVTHKVLNDTLFSQTSVVDISRYKVTLPTIPQNDTVFTNIRLDTINKLYPQVSNTQPLATSQQIKKTKQVSQNNNDTTKTETVKQKIDLNNLLGKYLKLIEINNTNIENGKLRFMQNDSIGNAKFYFENEFSIAVSDFVREFGNDSLKSYVNTPPFYSRDISVTFQNHSMTIEKQDYRLTAGKIGLSTSKSGIFANNINITPTRSLYHNQKKNNISFHVPKLDVKQIAFNKLVSEQLLEIDSIIFEVPQVNYMQKKKQAQRQKKQAVPKLEFSFSAPKKVKNISIGCITFKNGDLNLSKQIDNHVNQYSKSNFTLAFEGIHIDSTAFRRQMVNKQNINSISFRLNHFFHRMPDSLHWVKADEINISLLESKLNLKNLQITPNPNPYKNRKELLKQRRKPMLMNITIPKIAAAGIALDKYVEEKALEIPFLRMYDGTLTIDNYPTLGKDSIPPINIKNDTLWNIIKRIDLYQTISPHLAALEVADLGFRNIEVQVNKHTDDTVKSVDIKKLSGQMQHFTVDSNYLEHQDELFYTNDIKLKINDFTHRLADSVYTLKAGEIGLSYPESSMYIDNFEYKPRYPQETVASQLFDYQKGVIDLNVKQILIDSLDYDSYLKKNKLHVGYLTLDNANLFVYKDKNIPESQDRYPPLPQDMIMEAEKNVTIENVIINNSTIRYDQLAKKANTPGTIILKRVNGDITNITNDSTLLADNETAQANLTAYVMGRGYLDTHFEFPLTDPEAAYTIEGTMDTMEFAAFNPLLENLLSVSVKSGKIKKIRFQIQANDSIAEGEMHFRYKNLKVSLIDKQTGNTGILRAIGSFVANRLVVKKNNPTPGRFLREGEIYSKRNQNKAITHHWVQALISGLRSTLAFKGSEVKSKLRNERRIRREEEREARREQKRQEELKRQRLKELVEEIELQKKWEKQMKRYNKKQDRLERRKERKRKREQRREKRMERRIKRKMKDLLDNE